MSLQLARPRGRSALATLVFLGVLALSPSAAAATRHHPRRVRVGGPPVLPAGTTPVAGTASLRRMPITVALRPRHRRLLSRYAHGVSNPGSPFYDRYLTVAQFRRRFAPTAATVGRVEASLRAHGLHPGRLDANGLAFHVRASSARLERAFSVTLATVRTATGRDVVYATRAPAFNADVAHAVQAVIGMNGFARDTSHLVRPPSSASPFEATVSSHSVVATPQVATGGPQPCKTATKAANSLGGTYTTDQIASAYSFPGLYQHGDFGQGVTVGVYELERNLTTDIAKYQSCYGTHAKVSYVKVDSGAGGSTAGAGEAALDIEQVIGLAPRANILVYRGPNNGYGPYDVFASMIGDDVASVISTSWGDCEALIGAAAAAAEYNLFAEATIQGQTVVAAAGDAGSEDCFGVGSPNLDNKLGVDDPGSQPFVTSVGGTRMTAISPTPAETVWNGGLIGNPPIPNSGGGGLSSIWKMPAYQKHAANSLGVIQADSKKEGCGPTSQVPTHSYCRQVPDVAADADPGTGYLVYYNGTGAVAQPSGWQPVGGTSAAAPLWAALIADAQSSSTCRTRIGFLNGRLYSLAGTSQATYFHDVTSGNNYLAGPDTGLFPALAGYDMATGLGTPIASAIGPALCSQYVLMGRPGRKWTFRGSRVSLRLHARTGGGLTGPLRYGARGLPRGLKLDPATGKITGRPRRLGTRVVTVDAYTSTQVYGSAQFLWTVQARPRLRYVSLTNVQGGRPQLSFRLIAGRHEPLLRKIKVRLPPGLGPTRQLGSLLVFNKHGKLVRRRVARHGRSVTITLSRRTRKLDLLFGSGSLYATRAIRSDALRNHPASLKIVVTPIDTAGGTSQLHRKVRPRPF